MAESRTQAVILALFLVSSGLAATGSAGLQSYQSVFGGAPTPSSLLSPASAGGGEFFFSSVTLGTSSGPNSIPGPSGEMQAQPTQGLPPVPSQQVLGGVDYVFARQGSTYTVFQLSIGENDGPSPFLQSSSLPKVWLDSARRRSRFRICVEILEVLKAGPTTPFEISFHLRLNTKRTKGYLKLLTDKELLELSAQEGTCVYHLTPKGWAFPESVKAALLLDS